MVLLIQTTGRIVKQRDWHLHSSIVLLILSTNVPSGYSYFIFTFQYSSINTDAGVVLFFFLLLFTFQYSSINTLYQTLLQISLILNLHSSIVLLIPRLPQIPF